MTKVVLVSNHANISVYWLHSGRVASADDCAGRTKHKE
jgi:hypothetical protein